MTVKINADTSDGLKFVSDTSGIVEIQNNGTTVFHTSAPAFKAYLGSNQSISADTHTKVQFDTEDFDTNSNYDNSSNYRFTPTVSGYYMLNTQIFTDSGSSRTLIRFRKNGSEISNYDLTSSTINCITTNTLTVANGSSDYFEVFVQFVGAGKTLASGQTNTFFSGHFIRGL